MVISGGLYVLLLRATRKDQSYAETNVRWIRRPQQRQAVISLISFLSSAPFWIRSCSLYRSKSKRLQKHGHTMQHYYRELKNRPRICCGIPGTSSICAWIVQSGVSRSVQNYVSTSRSHFQSRPIVPDLRTMSNIESCTCGLLRGTWLDYFSRRRIAGIRS